MEPLESDIISFLELVYTTARVNELLPAGEKGMAFIADIDLDSIAFLGGAGCERSSASAYNRYFVIIGMYIGFHNSPRSISFDAKSLYNII